LHQIRDTTRYRKTEAEGHGSRALRGSDAHSEAVNRISLESAKLGFIFAEHAHGTRAPIL